ncbi:MAG: hypothetical protein Q9219_001369 [cf. Caloplaca sp. 3 TL-2023]
MSISQFASAVTTMPAAPQPKPLTKRQQQLLAAGTHILTTPEQDADIKEMDRKLRRLQAIRDKANPRRKKHRLLTKWYFIEQSTRITRYEGAKVPFTGIKTPRRQRAAIKDEDTTPKKTWINCRYGIPGTDKTMYWCRGVPMECEGDFKPWEKKR